MYLSILQILLASCRQSAVKLCQQILLTEHELNADTDGYGSRGSRDSSSVAKAPVLALLDYSKNN